MKYSICILFTLALSVGLLAQNKQLVEVSGIITNEEGSLLPFVHIIVINKRKGTIADEKGMFSFVAEPKDTIVFSSVGYKKRGILIPEVPDNQHYPIEVVLETDTIYLSPVEIYPWATYAEFKEAFVNLDLPETDIDRALKNFAIIKNQLFLTYEAKVYPSLNYKYVTEMNNFNAMNKGMAPPSLTSWVNNPLLNYVAWGNLIKMLQEGKFKRKKNK